MTKEILMTNDECERSFSREAQPSATCSLLGCCIRAWERATVRQASLRGAAKRIVLIVTLLVAGVAQAQDAAPAGPIVISPATVELRHPRQPQSLQVLATTA